MLYPLSYMLSFTF